MRFSCRKALKHMDVSRRHAPSGRQQDASCPDENCPAGLVETCALGWRPSPPQGGFCGCRQSPLLSPRPRQLSCACEYGMLSDPDELLYNLEELVQACTPLPKLSSLTPDEAARIKERCDSGRAAARASLEATGRTHKGKTSLGRPKAADAAQVAAWRREQGATIAATMAHFGISRATVARYCAT